MEQRLRELPAVDEILRERRIVTELLAVKPRSVVVEAVRTALNEARRELLNAESIVVVMDKRNGVDRIVSKAFEIVRGQASVKLQPVINATGVILHTNLGRALLSDKAKQAVSEIAVRYSNLELELISGQRGSRYAPLEPLLTFLTGAEAALVVNNNAAAVLLALSTLAGVGREVVVSRGQLVEIGGSFRIPEVMAQSGAKLVEVGATNKTHPADYYKAISEQTALLLHVHTSNYRIIGFTRETSIQELVEVGRTVSLPVMSDLGSGSLLDLTSFGLPDEPTVQQAVAAGTDVVTFSGDKLLGGPQAGIIVGRGRYIEQMKKNPLLRALRVDKMTVAALGATLLEYLDETKAVESLPTLQMLTSAMSCLKERAERLASLLRDVVGDKVELESAAGSSVVGGGSFPAVELPTALVRLRFYEISVSEIQSALRRGEPAVMSRVQDNQLLFDVRTLRDDELPALAAAVRKVVG